MKSLITLCAFLAASLYDVSAFGFLTKPFAAKVKTPSAETGLNPIPASASVDKVKIQAPVTFLSAISEEEVLNAQKAWGDSLVKISLEYEMNGFAAAKELAEKEIDILYGYKYGPVLFKPTLSSGDQTFRTTREGALAYFVGGDPNFPNDTGFALKNWRKVEIENASIVIYGTTASTLGNVVLYNSNGDATVVDKSWKFFKGLDGLKIIGHHSSLPFEPSPEKITEDDVLDLQKKWGEALVAISDKYEAEGYEAAKELATKVVDTAYGYQYGPVLFKPTLASGDQTFRTTREGAISYFVGGNPEYPNDKGFAIQGWTNVEVENAALKIDGSTGTSVGLVKITNKDGSVTTVEKTWTFLKAKDGKVVFTGHHSSLPYVPAKAVITEQEVLDMQETWGKALVSISEKFEKEGFDAAKELATAVVDSAYGYKFGPVLFKPTLASGDQSFRTTREGAIAYFVGSDPAYPNDSGFAIKGWTNVEHKNAAIYLDGSTGTSVGNVIITNKDGSVTTVEKTWTFMKCPDGKVHIMGHHSSIPFTPAKPIITEQEVLDMQETWGDALVAISETFEANGFEAAKELATKVVDTAYGYKFGPVLFKPTLASGDQSFRTTREGAIAYFVGSSPDYPDDTGFAIKGWTNVEHKNAAIYLDGSTGTSVGNVIITNKDGSVTTVEKTWTFMKCPDGKVHIMGHHSSLPFTPAKPIITEAEVLDMQKKWGNALVAISDVYEAEGFDAAKELATTVVDTAYGYQYGPVLFKPTLASGDQTFRTTRDGAISYFVGGDPEYPKDSGFAIKGWKKVEMENAAIYMDGSTGTSVGLVKITNKDGSVTTVEKTWTFQKCADGKVHIMGHHSSVPFTPAKPIITEAEVLDMQKKWGDALVAISTMFDKKGFEAAKALATKVVDTAYGYKFGPVLFKPTLATGDQSFRTTREGAIAYFVGGDPTYPNDSGFAIKGWTKVEHKNAAMYLDGSTGTSVGNVIITNKDGSVTTVEKTWTFMKCPDNEVHIMGHHSSLPYAPTTGESVAEKKPLSRFYKFFGKAK